MSNSTALYFLLKLLPVLLAIAFLFLLASLVLVTFLIALLVLVFTLLALVTFLHVLLVLVTFYLH